MSRTVNRTGARRTDERVPAIVTKSSPPRRSGDILDHGLDDHEWIHVWANKTNHMEVNQRYLDGWRFVHYSDVEAALKRDERSAYLYQGDENNRVVYGHELALMRLARREYEANVREALTQHAAMVSDMGASALERQIDDLMHRTDMSVKSTPRVVKDEDHGTQESFKIEGSEDK